MSQANTIAPIASPIAFISDIHGNLSALERVLERLEQQGVRHIYAAGDLLLGPPGSDAAGVWRRLRQAKVECVRGLSEEALIRIDGMALDPDGKEQEAEADHFLEVRRAIGDLVVQQLKSLPQSLEIPLIDGRRIFVVHGSPADPLTEIEHHMEDDTIEHLVHTTAAEIVVCGASHVPFRRDLEQHTVISVGSLGASPTRGVAHYCVMTPRMDGLEVVLEDLEL